MIARRFDPGTVPHTGALAGLAFAAVLLVALAYLLLRPDHVTLKALVPVWLMALPISGISATLGYAAGRLLEGWLSTARGSAKSGIRPNYQPYSASSANTMAGRSAHNAVETARLASLTAAATAEADHPLPGGIAEPLISELSPRLRLGVALERQLTRVEALATRGPLPAIALGAALGAVTIAGGVALFVFVWYALVTLFA